MEDDLKKNLWKIILVIIGIIGGIGPFTFLKGCFKSTPNPPVIINPYVPTESKTTYAATSNEPEIYRRSEATTSKQTEDADNIIDLVFSFVGVTDYNGYEDSGSPCPDLHVQINYTKKEVIVNGCWSELDGNSFTYAGNTYKLTYLEGLGYQLVGEALGPMGPLYFIYEAQ